MLPEGIGLTWTGPADGPAGGIAPGWTPPSCKAAWGIVPCPMGPCASVPCPMGVGVTVPCGIVACCPTA
eukprot:scaffold212366_cov37-Tisochrysis_lutea.AAC.4